MWRLAPYFELKDVEARKIAGDVARGVANGDGKPAAMA